jgi:hypothetical protein
LLIGARDESFEWETELRLFQFKAWLLGVTPSSASFRRSALLFATLLVSARQKQRRFSLLASSEALVLAMMSRELRPLIDLAFKARVLYDLTQISFHPYKEADRKKPLEEISALNALTQFRLRLRFTKRMTPSINNGIALLSNSKDDTQLGRTNAKALRRRRRAREAFLYAAQNCHEMMFLPPKPADVVGALKSEVRETERIKEYFALSKSLMKILDVDAAEAFEGHWNDMPPVDIPPLEPVSVEEMDEAGIGPRPRRGAKETKLAKRQAPTGSK